MKREPRGWRDASKAFLSLHGVACKLPYLCQRPAGSKSEPRRGFRCIRRGAYGAVGFRGVKDAPKERPICRRFSVGRLTMRDFLGLWTNPGQILGKHCAPTEQTLSIF